MGRIDWSRVIEMWIVVGAAGMWAHNVWAAVLAFGLFVAYFE